MEVGKHHCGCEKVTCIRQGGKVLLHGPITLFLKQILFNCLFSLMKSMLYLKVKQCLTQDILMIKDVND